jgi:asparagine synthase (glutamine-hydrolysing)
MKSYMNKVVLKHNSGGFSWQKSENLSVKGYLFDRYGRFYEAGQLLEYFKGISSFSDLDERVSYANGCFSVIFHNNDDLYAASDAIRAFPVFYKKYKGDWILSDDAYLLMNDFGSPEVNDLACQEFLATGCVTGDETLIRGISQVQAGELLQFRNNGLKRKFFFTYRTHITSNAEYDELRILGNCCGSA